MCVCVCVCVRNILNCIPLYVFVYYFSFMGPKWPSKYKNISTDAALCNICSIWWLLTTICCYSFGFNVFNFHCKTYYSRTFNIIHLSCLPVLPFFRHVITLSFILHWKNIKMCQCRTHSMSVSGVYVYNVFVYTFGLKQMCNKINFLWLWWWRKCCCFPP